MFEKEEAATILAATWSALARAIVRIRVVKRSIRAIPSGEPRRRGDPAFS